ncbi:putative F-actin-capping protein subunit beta [Cardiosporidium cionae]|uniref:F-actin-capping protein subunit beta n=1 Tax=Cardiosporidium cionae TaxID=476202 RepID=A0ABQ7JFJ6_9APIC|nr:putative F-actin-capping protein subunit beta [Cardiosporidium cionae]|eukprot:KAF8822762.1 putative F-actin-capping protein subunit beta [Cardiosporidium cionae]
MEKQEQLTSALNLLRRLPPQDLSETLAGLLKLAPTIKEDILRRTFVPFKLLFDENVLFLALKGKYFIGCEYNQEDVSFRSPWSNAYIPSSKRGYYPKEFLRELEVEYNALFDEFREAYYDGGVSSVYLWEVLNKNGFAGAFCMRKDFDYEQNKQVGEWNSIHVIKVIRESQNVNYSLDSELHLRFSYEGNDVGSIDFGCQASRTNEKHSVLTAGESGDIKGHITIIGSMIDEAEGFLRKRVEQLLLPRIREVARKMCPSSLNLSGRTIE